MHLVLLGHGRFSRSFLESFQESSHSRLTIVPARQLDSDDLISRLYELKPTHVIDLLDPSTDLIPTFDYIYDRNLRFRSSLPDLPDSRYYYVSTVNLYQHASGLINEQSTLRVIPSKGYLCLKHYSECLLEASAKNLSILRVPSLYYPLDQCLTPISFLDDLILSRSCSQVLPSREGDDLVFTYMSARLAARTILDLVIEDTPSLINISSQVWSTRFCLKNAIEFVDNFEQGLRITTVHQRFLPINCDCL